MTTAALETLDALRDLLKIDSICIDNNVFRLHYKATVLILVIFALVVTSTQFIGDPIDCIVDEIPLDVMDTYCWIYSTFTLSNRLEGLVGRDVIHPGVGHFVGDDEVRYHKYYQWVCFVLAFQAILFYLPRHLWKTWEAGRMRTLTLDLNYPYVYSADRKKLIVDYFRHNLHAQNFYAYRFLICEVLNLANVIGQIFFMDLFLDGEFRTYGWDVLTFTEMDPELRVDPMARVFPKVTKCTFRKYGPSGTIQVFDGLCVLPVNIVNEKIYIFLWFWFVLLSGVSALHLLYRIALFLVRPIRFYSLLSKCSGSARDHVRRICQKFYVGDWFVLSQLGVNIDPIIFNEIVTEIAENLDKKDADFI